MKSVRAKTHEEVLKTLLQNHKFQRGYEEELKKLRITQSLIELREHKHLTQTQLAHRLGVSQPFIAKVESGESLNFNLETLLKIASALGTELEIRFRPRLIKKAA